MNSPVMNSEIKNNNQKKSTNFQSCQDNFFLSYIHFYMIYLGIVSVYLSRILFLVIHSLWHFEANMSKNNEMDLFAFLAHQTTAQRTLSSELKS